MKSRLLQRQVERHLGQVENYPDIQSFLEAVDFTYNQLVSERRMVDKATESMLRNAENLNNNLKRLNESLDSFNYHISHDLKTGFMNTIGLSKMMHKYLEAEDYPKLKEILEKQIENSNSALNLIDQFLEIAKLDREFTTNEKESVKIIDTINEIVPHIPDLKPENVIIERADFKQVFYNRHAFISIFSNLLSNSSKYRCLDKELKITLNLINEEGSQLIIYQDNGIGIDLEQNRSKLFKPFMRFSNSSNIEGTGIGLFLVKKIIESEHGEVILESTPSYGVKFRIKL